MRTKLLVRGVAELGKDYTIVPDLDSLRSNYNTRSFDSKSSVIRTPFLLSSISLAPNPPLERTTSKENEVMIAANPPSKLLSNLVPPLSVIDVKVMVTSPLIVLAK